MININHVTGSEFGNQVLRAFAEGKISVPLVVVEVSGGNCVTVKDIEGRDQPELRSMYVQSLKKSGEYPFAIMRNIN